MWFRVILAAILGGAVVLGAGYLEHEILHWPERQFKVPNKVTELRDAISSDLGQVPGIYHVPVLKDLKSLSEEEKKQVSEDFKKGPAGMFVLRPTGEDMMETMKKQVLMELGADVLAAFLAAVVLALSRPGLGYFARWFLVIVMGLFSWLSINASYFIWYRFPWPWVQDELYCALLEWALAGIIMAALIKPKRYVPGYD